MTKDKRKTQIDVEKIDTESNDSCCLGHLDIPSVIHAGKDACNVGEVGYQTHFQDPHSCKKKYDLSVSTTDLSSFTCPTTPSSPYFTQYSTSRLTTPVRDDHHQNTSRFSLSSFSQSPSSMRNIERLNYRHNEREWSDRRIWKQFFIDEEQFVRCGESQGHRHSAHTLNVDLKVDMIPPGASSKKDAALTYNNLSLNNSFMVDSSLSSSGISEDKNETGIHFREMPNGQFHTLSDCSRILCNPTVTPRKSSISKEKVSNKYVLPTEINLRHRLSIKTLVTTCQISMVVYSVVVLVLLTFQSYSLPRLIPTIANLKGTYRTRLYLKEIRDDTSREKYQVNGVNSGTVPLQRNIGGLHLAFYRYEEEKKFNQLRRNPGLGALDKKLYGVSKPRFRKKLPRTMNLYYHDRGHTPLKRYIDVYPTVFSDNTQMYGILESGDESLAQMERRNDLSDNQCVPMEEWQTAYHPICNTLHELDLIHLGDSIGNNIQLVGKQGYWRNAWKLDLFNNNFYSEKGSVDTLILKTPK